MNEKQLKAYVQMKNLALVQLEEGELTTATLIAQLKKTPSNRVWIYDN